MQRAASEVQQELAEHRRPGDMRLWLSVRGTLTWQWVWAKYVSLGYWEPSVWELIAKYGEEGSGPKRSAS
jgi:hypothetical protein